jgi:hypothetical protein
MTARAKISLLACVCAATLASCGSNRDATIPPANSEQMLAVLAAVERYASSGDCQLAQQQADEFKNQVVLLPAEVDDEVKQGLFDVADKLNDLAQDPSQCVDQGASGPTGLQPATQPSTTSVPATTESTTTTESSSTTTTETETPANTGGDGTTPAEPPADQAPAGGGDGGGGPTSGGIGQKGAIR